MSEEEIGPDKMRDALSAIATEMQKLHNESLSSSLSEKCENEEIFNKLIKCKTTLSLRKVQIKKLRQNLKTACHVAKTMSTAKATETASLHNHLDIARNQYLDLMKQQNEKCEIINKLTVENQSLHDQLEYFNNIIHLGYNELQKIRNERVENISILEQLKHIIVCCGQYYADHCNEHEKSTRLEQKNRFLSNKISIMENNLDSASRELRNLQMNLRPHREKRDYVTRTRQSLDVVCSEYETGHNQSTVREKRDCVTKSRQRFDVVCSEYKMGPHKSNITNLTMTKIELNKHSVQTSSRDLDLTTHLRTVKKLLHDQENLIKDLRNLSKVIINEEPYTD